MLFLEFVTSSREPDNHAKLQSVHGKILDGVADFMGEMQKKGLFGIRWMRNPSVS